MSTPWCKDAVSSVVSLTSFLPAAYACSRARQSSSGSRIHRLFAVSAHSQATIFEARKQQPNIQYYGHDPHRLQQKQQTEQPSHVPVEKGKAETSATAAPLLRRMSTVSRTRLQILEDLDSRLTKYEAKIPGFQSAVKKGSANASQLGVIKGELGQLFGDLEKLQYNEIDAVITGDLETGREDARAMRKGLTKRTARMLDEVKRLVDEVKRYQHS